MSIITVRRTTENNEKIGDFLNEGFTQYGEQNGVALNYDDFCFVAEDDNGTIAGVITGRAYYKLRVVDLIQRHYSQGV